jgi:hypothetical protein
MSRTSSIGNVSRTSKPNGFLRERLGFRVASWAMPVVLGSMLLAPLVASAQGTKAAPAASSAPPAATIAAPAASSTAATTAASTAPSATVGTTGGTLDSQSYTVRLRDLEQRINDLKERIRRSHTRLALLSESIISGVTAAARAEIVFQNDMSSAFRLRRVVALYDGAPLATKTDERDQIGDQKEIPLYAELVQPGDHTIQILLEYQGNGYGIFSYLKGYKFEVRSSRSFTAIEGKTLQLRVVGYEQGGPTTPLEERPAVRYVEKIQVGVGSGGKK